MPRGYQPIENTGGSVGGTASDITLDPIAGVSGPNVQNALGSIADKFTQKFIAEEAVTKFYALSKGSAVNKAILSSNNDQRTDFIGFALENATIDQQITVQDEGEIVNPAWSALGAIRGQKAWLSPTLGAITNTLPPVGSRLIYIGIFKNSTTIEIADMTESRDFGIRKK